MKEQSAIRFDAHGKTWGATVLRPTDQDLPSLKMKYLCEALDGRTGRLLEIGSSSGKHLRSLLALGYRFECYGNDIDKVSINFGHGIIPSALFVVADGHRLPFRSGSFDAALIMDYLEHVEDPKLAIDEALRILKNDGILHISVPCEGTPLSIYALFKRIFGFNVMKPAAGHVQNFKHTDIFAMLSDPGYQVQSVYYSYHVLGSLMDFTLFLLVYLSKSVERLYWRHNKFYHGSQRGRSSAVAVFNAALVCFNRLAFFESWKLQRISDLASDIHLTLAKHRRR